MKDLIQFIAQALVEHPPEIEVHEVHEVREVEAGRGGGFSLDIVGPSESGAE